MSTAAAPKVETPNVPAPSETPAPEIEETFLTPKTEEPPKDGEPKADGEGKPKEENVLELKLPDGSLLEATHVEAFKTLAKELGLSQETAQKLLDRENASIGDFHKQRMTQFEETKAGWLNQIKEDKEIGGANLKESQVAAARVIEAIDPSSEFKKFLSETGLGNHPLLVRAFVRLGKKMGNDSFMHAGAQAPAVGKSVEELFYGKNE